VRQRISAEPTDPDKPFAHLEPLLAVLRRDGNDFSNHDGFYLAKDGWRADFKHRLNLELLRREFDIPASIELSEDHDSVLCKNTWCEIKGCIFPG